MRTRLVDTSRPGIRSALIFLQNQLFPSDEVVDPESGHWWITWDGEVPAAFSAMRIVPSWSHTFYLARCGVLSNYRGQGLQRHMLQRREALAKELGAKRLITTTYRNPRSANNLIAKGYLTYEPSTRWGAPDTIYWIKEFPQ